MGPAVVVNIEERARNFKKLKKRATWKLVSDWVKKILLLLHCCETNFHSHVENNASCVKQQPESRHPIGCPRSSGLGVWTWDHSSGICRPNELRLRQVLRSRRPDQVFWLSARSLRIQSPRHGTPSLPRDPPGDSHLVGEEQGRSGEGDSATSYLIGQ